jgi:DNA ligase (NAD+)
LDRLAQAEEEELAAIHGIGPTIARAVAGFFHDATNQRLLERLETLGVRMDEPAAKASGELSGAAYVITGTLPTLARAEATRLLETQGARVTQSVSKKTTALVAGADPGSKLEKATRLGIEVIDEAELLRRLGSGT